MTRGIRGFHFFYPQTSGGLCSEDHIWVFAGQSIKLRTNFANLTDQDLLDHTTPKSASLSLSKTTILMYGTQINPWDGASGVYLGNNTDNRVFGGLATSGVYYAPFSTSTPRQFSSNRWTSIEGDSWQRKAASDFGLGRRIYNTGSGVATFAIASGFFYGAIAANIVVPASTGSWTSLPWAYTHTVDKCLSHSTSPFSNTEIICMHEGWYEITYSLTFFKLATVSYSSALSKCTVNGVAIKGSNQMSAALLGTNGNNSCWSGLLHLKRGDKIKVEVREYNTNDANIYVLSDYGALKIKYLGPGI